MAASDQKLNLYKISAQKLRIGSCSSDLVKKIGMDMIFDPETKLTEDVLIAFDQKSNKFDPTNHISARHLDPIHLIWRKFS